MRGILVWHARARCAIEALVRRRIIWSLALGVVAAAAAPSACSDGSEEPRAGLVFTRTNGQRSSVWVAEHNGVNARRAVAGAIAGMLSPDGRTLAYGVAQDDPSSGRAFLYVVSVAGGRPRLIGEARDYAWSPDSARLAVSNGRALTVLDPASGKRRRLARGLDIGGLSFAPDGGSIAYHAGNRRAGPAYRSDVFVVRLADRRVTRLTRDGYSDHPLWGRGWIVHRRFHISGTRLVGRLRIMRPDGSAARRFARGDERPSSVHLGLLPVAVAADGDRLLACAETEFSCPPVTFTLPGGERNRLSIDDPRATITADDIAGDGREVLVDAGAFDDNTHRRVYAIPFRGGKAKLLARDATAASWAR